MPEVEISSLSIQVEASAAGASKELDGLASALSRLAANSKVTKTVNALNKLKTALAGLSSASGAVSAVDKLASAMSKLSSLQKLSGLNSALNTLAKLPGVVSGINPTVLSQLAAAVTPLASAMSQLGGIEKASGLNSVLNTLKKIPEITEKLKATDLDAFAAQLERVRAAVAPLASAMDSVSRGFSSLPANITRAASAGQKWASTAATMQSRSTGLGSSIRQLVGGFSLLYVVNRVAQFLGASLANFNEYVENVNLFRVSMGDLADEATAATAKMQELLGVDASAAMRNMGVIQNLVTSFGLAGDQAYVLSQNITQLGYDMASFFNLDIEDSFQKLQAAISGEIEPIRRLGVDISEARLQQELYQLGIDATVSSLNQADKAILRYIAIMEQTGNAQTDMARTLNSPANQIRILEQQVTLLARSIGSLLIPALNAILPPVIAVVQVLREAISSIAGFFGIEVEFADTTGSASSTLGGMSSGLDDVASSAGSAADAVKMLIGGFDELNVLPEPSSGSGGGGASGGGSILGDVELPSYDMFEGLSGKIGELTEKIKSGLKEILPLVVGIGAALAAWKLGKAWPSIVSAVSSFASKVGSVIKLLTGPFSTALATTGSGVAGGFSLSPLLAFTAAVGIIAAQFTNLMLNSENFRNGLTRIFETAKQALAGFWSAFTSALQPAADALSSFGEKIMNILPPGLKEQISQIMASISDVIDSLDLNLGDLLTTLAGVALMFIPGGQIAGAAVLAFEAITVAVRAFGGKTDEEMASIQQSVTQHWESIGRVVGGLVSGIVTTVVGELDGIITFLDGVFSLDVEKILQGISKTFTSLFDGVFTFLREGFGVDIPQAVENWRQTTTEKAMAAGQSIRQAISDAINFIGVQFNNAGTTVKNWASSAWSAVSGFASNFVSSIQNAVGRVGDFFSGLISSAWNWGRDLINGFIQGIQQAAQNLWTTVSNIASGVAEYIHFSRPDKGPLRDYETWMPDMVAGLAKTLDQSSYMLGNAANRLATRLAVNSMLAPEFTGAAIGATPRGAQVQSTDNSAALLAAVNALSRSMQGGDVVVAIDGKEVFRAVRKQAQRQQMRTGQPAFL